MPPKAKPRARSGRSKSVEKKKPVRSRSSSRSRVAKAKPKDFNSETKRPRSKTPETSVENSPIKSSSRSIASTTRTVSSKPITVSTKTTTKCDTKSHRSGMSCISVQVCKAKSCFAPVCSNICPIVGFLTVPIFLLWINCYVLNAKSEWGTSVVVGKALIPSDVMTYLNWRVWCFVALQIIKSAIVTNYLKCGPRLSVVAGGRKLDYVNNYWLVILLFVAPLILFHFKGDLIYKGFKPATYVMGQLPSFLASLYVYSLILAFWAYYSSIRKLQRTGVKSNTGSFIIDFYNGRELRPVFLGLDMKIFCVRLGVSFFSFFMVTLGLIQYEKMNTFSPAFALVCFAFTVRLIDYCIFEHYWLTTFTVQSLGFGMRYLNTVVMIPSFLWYSTGTYYFMNPEIGRIAGGASCDPVKLGISAVVFMIGYYVHRASWVQKYTFRRDPHHPTFANMETVPTSSGKRLLAGGYWGLVRHPNFLGELIMSFGYSLPGCCAHPLLWLYPVMTFIMLCMRISEIDATLSNKHGSAWSRYKSLVPKRIIPGIY